MSMVSEFAAFIGIDWGDETHAVCLAEAGRPRPEKSVIEQESDALDR